MSDCVFYIDNDHGNVRSNSNWNYNQQFETSGVYQDRSMLIKGINREINHHTDFQDNIDTLNFEEYQMGLASNCYLPKQKALEVCIGNFSFIKFNSI
jgi:hypothetical protein